MLLYCLGTHIPQVSVEIDGIFLLINH